MQPTELRIGIFFYRIDRTKEVHIPISIPLKVITIGFDGCDCLHYEQNPALVSVWDNVKYNDISPIPLTEEWLLKMDLPNDGSTRDLLGNYDVWLERNGCDLLLMTETSSRKIEFVHTAQNLYFDLKGEDLLFTASQSKH